MTNAIVVEEITRRFPQEARPAVDHVSFSVTEGDFVVLLGPSGCGKTTLLKMINRLYEPTAGRIFIGDVDARSLPVTDLRRRIGYAIQQTGLFPHMRIEQNIAVVPRLLGWDKLRIDARIDTLLDLVHLPRSYRTRYPRQLSGGEQQRVGLARALAADPAIMLMDEPFGAIDAITRTHLQDELLQIQRKLHKTILFVTHDVDEALRLADKIIIMRQGNLVQYDTPLGIINQPHDTFVQQLIGADDILRRLSLISVGVALNIQAHHRAQQRSNVAPTTRTSVNLHDSLRSALAHLLRCQTQTLSVTDPDGRVVGQLNLADIQAAVADRAIATSE